MANKMLIDATHPEETRVVVLRGSRVEEFDFESASKKQLRGNIYLAKVTRVEPSLQAAFIEYGGNRHGFLAFSEIHPDYYQIPVSDRQALLEADAAEQPEDEEEERKPRRSRRRRGGDRNAAASRRDQDDTISENAGDEGGADAGHADRGAAHQDERSDNATSDDETSRPIELKAEQTPPYDDPTPDLIDRASEVRSGHASPASVHSSETGSTTRETPPAPVEPARSEDPTAERPEPAKAHEEADVVEAADTKDGPIASDADVDIGSSKADAAGDDARHADDEPHADAHHDEDDHEEDEEEHVEQLGGDAMEEIPVRSYRPRKQYKIQEVIKRRQVLLVQVVKEERGNKGAALTTYLSLAGRYSVLMPNTARGGGISRKITDATDRQRLKSIAQALDVPDGMGVILRTAGAARSTPEVKRDFEYLMRMWETVRETTLSSTAPTLVYEEGSLIKRSIRDLYNKDVEEVVVAGEEGYREAKDFMRLLMPSHARNVQPWRDPAPIFTKAGAEAQLDAMFSSHVTLKSGGYIVINQTEALVAIDVNSGRSTREHNIEDTAVRTNLEAADEVARQLRLRDLAGLIVVDFIDMEESRNNRSVERRMKDALKNDRARIQIGRISHFGLLEMSRQRIRTGVLEGSTVMCEHCAGAGMVRSTSSIALHVLRVIEDALIADASRNLIVRARASVALYVLNQKRAHLADLEGRFGASVTIESDEHLTGMTYCAVDRGDFSTGIIQPARVIVPIAEPDIDDVEDEASVEEDVEDGSTVARTADDQEDGGESRRKRRRRRGRGRDRESSGIADDAPQPSDDALGAIAESDLAPAAEGGDTGESGSETGGTEERDGRRRRSRRGGRRSRGERSRPSDDGAEMVSADGRLDGAADAAGSDDTVRDDRVEGAQASGPDGAAERPAHELEPADATPPTVVEPPSDIEVVAASPSPVVEPASETVHDAPPVPRRPEPTSSETDPAKPKRSGWWQRAKATLGS